MRCALFAEGELHVGAAVPALHPEVGVVLVFLDVHARDGVEEPGAVGGEDGATDAADFGEVVEID